MTIREFIEHRKVATSMISFPLWLAGFALLAYGGKHSAWTPANYIGVCVLLRKRHLLSDLHRHHSLSAMQGVHRAHDGVAVSK